MRRGFDKRGKDILFFLSAILFVILLSNLSSAATRNCWSCENCTAEIGSAIAGDVIQLNQSLSGVSGDCISFSGKDNITFDCQNYSNFIKGDGLGTDYGVYLNPSGADMAINNTIRNCNVSGFYGGISTGYSSPGNNNTLINITANNNSVGIDFYQSSNNILANIISTNNSLYGIYLQYSHNNTLTNITANNNGVGVGLSYSNNNTLINITANSNNLASYSQYGIKIAYSNNNTLRYITANYNKANGIYMYSSPYTNLSNGNFNSNGNGSVQQSGIFLYGSDNSILFNNTIVNNTYGIYIGYTSNLTLKYNNLTNNQRNFYVGGSSVSQFVHNIDVNNTVNNKSIYYWVNHNNEQITASSNAGYVAVINSLNITVRDLNITNNGQGVLFYNSSNSTIINLSLSYNYYGIQINDVPASFITVNNTIANNSISYSDVAGIIIQYSDNTTLINNTIVNNGLSAASGQIATGMYLRRNNKIIMRNNTMNGNKYNFLLLNSISLMDIDMGNKMEGKSMYFLSNQMNTEINASHNPGFVGLVNCTNITIRDLNMSNNGENFVFEGLNNSRIYNITSVTTLYNFLINNSHNNVFSDIFSNNSLQTILYFTYSTNNTMIRISSTELYVDAIYLGYSYGNRIYNSSFSNNHYGRGIYIQYTNNTLVDGVQTYNISYGISISLGSNNNIVKNSVFSNNTAGAGSNNGRGIEIYLSDNNTFINVKVNGSLYDGVAIVGNNNTFINLTSIENNQSGFNFYQNSQYNVISNSHIENNTLYGLYFQYSGSNNNFIYNNYIRNNINYKNDVGVTNYFNTTKTLLSSGTNVIGGNYLGGNFWATLNNTGFSQLCNDSDADGICDTEYNIDGLNYDYLPLYSEALVCIPTWTCTAWTTCSGGIQTRTCTDIYSCNSTMNKPAESQLCTSGGGTSTTTTTTSVPSIPVGEPTTVTITNPNIEVGSVTITTTENVSGVSVTVTEVPRARVADFEIGISTKVIYQALNITISGLNNSQIANATVNFRVNKSWVEERLAESNDILLFRRNDTTRRWEALNTTYVNEDAYFYYYTAITPGFSTFVIFYGRYECGPGINRCFESQVQMCLGNATWLTTEKCQYGCDEQGECVKTAPFKFDLKILYLALGIVIVGLIVVFLSRRIPIGKNKSSKKVRSSLRYNQSLHKSKSLQ